MIDCRLFCNERIDNEVVSALLLIIYAQERGDQCGVYRLPLRPNNVERRQFAMKNWLFWVLWLAHDEISLQFGRLS
jgi:hypothetical protein